jgi:hypothetical protein
LFTDGEVVEHHNVAGPQRRHEHLFEVGVHPAIPGTQPRASASRVSTPPCLLTLDEYHDWRTTYEYETLYWKLL